MIKRASRYLRSLIGLGSTGSVIGFGLITLLFLSSAEPRCVVISKCVKNKTNSKLFVQMKKTQTQLH